MNYNEGKNRTQTILFPELIDDYITSENPVRFTDAFVEQLDMSDMGFSHAELKDTGRPPYNPKDLLKLYLYGYLNRIRSSRLLERETERNLELFWLLKRLSPDHKTISDFRRNNSKAIRKVYKEFIQLCRKLELFGAELIAVDSTKFRASNARDRIKDSEQLGKSIERIEDSISEYMSQLDENDVKDNIVNVNGDSLTCECTPMGKEELEKKISFLKKRKDKLEEAKKQIEENGEKYISLTDPDCRLVKNQGKIEPGYSIHNAVDSKHSLIVDYEVTQDAADNNHLSTMAISAKEALGVEVIKVCSDAGYYDSVDLKKCEDEGITTYVPIPEQKVSPKDPLEKKTNVPQPDYFQNKFVYEAETDSYCCPEGNLLNYYITTTKDDRKILIYRTASCKECSVSKLCTTSPRGRYIHRWEDQAVLERLKHRLQTESHIIKKRKAIVEHPFGTMKKVWGYSTFLLRGIEKVSSEVSLMTLSYNIKRAITIVGVIGLIKAL